ncbi:MAG: hypothetical protein VYA17_03770 [Pseudomonadota bacterium]|nr:hypothetical protein [Pseudomonadota bacterium]
MNDLLNDGENSRQNLVEKLIRQALREHRLFVLGIFLTLRRNRVEMLAEEAVADSNNSGREVSAFSYSLF